MPLESGVPRGGWASGESLGDQFDGEGGSDEVPPPSSCPPEEPQ